MRKCRTRTTDDLMKRMIDEIYDIDVPESVRRNRVEVIKFRAQLELIDAIKQVTTVLAMILGVLLGASIIK